MAEILVILNTAVTVGAVVAAIQADRARTRAEADAAGARYEATTAATELVALRSAVRRLGERNKLLAREVRADDTSKTGVWPQRKHTVWHR